MRFNCRLRPRRNPIQIPDQQAKENGDDKMVHWKHGAEEPGSESNRKQKAEPSEKPVIHSVTMGSEHRS